MPVFNTHFQEGKGKDQHGNTVTVPPAELLQRAGPILPATLSSSKSPQSGGPPYPVSGRVLIDTGATRTCVDINAARQAGLKQVGTGSITSSTHSRARVPVFAGKIIVEGSGMTINVNQAAGANLSAQNLVALIGRDVLSKCILVYNGPDGSFSLAL